MTARAWEFRDQDGSLCAHLCAVRRADYDNEHGLAETTDTYDEPIRVIDPDEERAEQAVEEIVADGGRRYSR